MFSNVWRDSSKISWLDVGAGYGEVVEAVSTLAPEGSRIEGIEPMKTKAIQAQNRGLQIEEKYLSEVQDRFDFISLVNVYSHIPDFHSFMEDIKRVLVKQGELYLETGNIADLSTRNEAPAELDLPDHLVFAGEKHIRGYLEEAGFSIVKIRRIRKDGFNNFVKNIIKKLIGRQVKLRIPYTSRYRALLIRARLDSVPSQ
jgi:SAM-dependent methyltransferase